MNTVDERGRAEVKALAALGGVEIAGAVGGIHSVHRAISDRVFSAVRLGVGPAVVPVRALHNGITDGVYAGIGIAARTAGRVAAVGAAWPGDRPPSETPRGAALIGALLGLIGDDLDAAGSPLADEPMTIRVDGAVVHLGEGRAPLGRLDPGEVFDGASGRVVVFLHGLCETEHAWGLGGLDADDYGVRLAVDLGATPVYVRYNSGRHISDNGDALADLLERLVAVWPVAITELVLIGHSMGGLVVRGAVHRAQSRGAAWPDVVTATVSLGTPHLGAPLEQAAHYGSAALAAVPETAPFGRLLRRRSAGIRDLRGGSVVDEDWRGRDADALGGAIAAEVPLMAGAEHFFVAATVTRDARNPLGRIIGDGLVLGPSAAGGAACGADHGRGRTRRIGFAAEAGMHLGGAHHFTLLRSDAVYTQLREWLTQPRCRAGVTGE
ncbi:PGAP1 family protein OS=Tsukamurella paurometabola (strain ATCC 8368 / DSM / CCUG 35730 / CIP 100753 / JCM 10117 / KCTC 9821 / NBRC 16120 / NCIMB 702349/ NCTC 13040) OX=521096 GN=Tpau_2983 PE=4 SV=1 [Tsukamurella paurometabola]|uniref:PGAP1 family protein n=1 Tax=Tsukamurella paurometabola (strain ATCC 8368 / DSM 20162 / CCUG 35730 / CIP 100753 / JCM 10117 / KCTC 9821 / NBRC 16120 / NCIMB 702349 / NCTC 13040) TaxID=521096 RepID=D5UU76_TSUPD|nr:alpha/beta fold hydrolase [Tsukamurella paurometabola]ADG79579.1 PGAP1 family protein [Tsukamurella paurometabola DSM 20162]SUP36313.1 PGAP1-like protein [Tsukamurella paurometabola]